MVQTADDLDRIIHHDVDVIGAYRDFARPAPKRNRRDDGPAACRPWPSTSSAMASTVHKWAHIGHCSETRVPAFLRRYCQWVWQSLFRHCEQSRPRLQLGAGQPGTASAVGVGVDRQVVHRFSLSGCHRVRRHGHQFTTVTRLRDKITSSHAPLSRVTVTASR